MEPDPRTGLFSSLLVPQEPSGQLPKPEKAEKEKHSKRFLEFEKYAETRLHDIQPASEVETAFRHGRWTIERARVRAALVAANVPAARVERFDACGANCVVEYSPSLQKHRVRASYCHDRFCEPCSNARSKKIKELLLEWCQGETVRFLTLTRSTAGESLQDAYANLYASFRKLRHTNVWKKSVTAGAALTEITRGDKGDHWHVHLHVLVIGSWVDRDLLLKAWRKATDGSTGVFIRPVRDTAADIGYTAKYASKGWNSQVVEDHDLLVECILTLRCKRLLITFGDWYARDDQLCKAQQNDWKRVGRLEFIYRESIRGEHWAIGIFRSLCMAAGSVGGVPTFIGCDPPWKSPAG